MVIHNKIVNKPSDQTGECPVSDAVLVFSRPKLTKPAYGRLLLGVLNSRRFDTYYLRGFVGAGRRTPTYRTAATECAMKNGFH